MVLSRRAQRTVGGDYSEVMIQWARRLLTDDQYRNEIATQLSPLWPIGAGSAAIDFQVANIVELDVPPPAFDVITGQRILINLPSTMNRCARSRTFAGLLRRAQVLSWWRQPNRGMLQRTRTAREILAQPLRG
jgi:hypothetical protein